jgi:predicted AAA+ superfamily ATPase
LDKLIRKKHNGLIKVVTGIRRCGKSYLLFNLFHNHLLNSGVAESQIIEVALDDRSNKALRDPDNMLRYVKDRIVDSEQYYIILDEVQLLEEFEDVLNSFLHIKNADIYVTGSNSRFLSSDVITEFRGRGDEIHVYPLSFREFISVYDGSMEEAWDDYFNYGGLPLIMAMETAEDKVEYLNSLFQKVYLSDIVDRYKVRNKEELDELVDILASAIGSLTNPTKLARTMKTIKNKSITDKTLKTYIEYLEDAFLISKAKRYIGSPSKYYFEDIGLRNARLNFRQVEVTHIMENIIYNELRIRGYKVDVGMVEHYGSTEEGKRKKKQLEVDFVASKGSEKIYIQSAFSLTDPEKVAQERRSLVSIPDSFKKIIIVADNIKILRYEDGIATMGLRDFLTHEDSLTI